MYDSFFRGHKDKIFVIKWNPSDNTKLVTVGVKHIKFWTQTGNSLLHSNMHATLRTKRQLSMHKMALF